jgi:hypothetical protein
VLFHSAFQLRTPIATMTSLSLFVVVLTGLIGFYIYALVPKTTAKVLKERLTELQPLLPGFVAELEKLVKESPVTVLRHNASIFRILWTLPRWVLEARRRRRAVKRAAKADKLFRVLQRTEPHLARAFVAELTDLLAKEVDAQAGGAMMRSWRSVHRFLAILMVVSVSVHIGVAWFYGFRWIFQK